MEPERALAGETFGKGLLQEAEGVYDRQHSVGVLVKAFLVFSIEGDQGIRQPREGASGFVSSV